MVIPGVVGLPAAAPARRRAAPGGPFLVERDARADAPAPVSAGAGLAGLLAVQESTGTPPDAAAEADRAAQQHAGALLRELGSLQASLLRGGGGALPGLAALAGGIPQAADPRLAAVLGALRQRAEVELARAALRPESDTENPCAPNR